MFVLCLLSKIITFVTLLSYSDTSVCFYSGIWELCVILSMFMKHLHTPNLYLKRNHDIARYICLRYMLQLDQSWKCYVGNFLISIMYRTYKWNLSSVNSLLAGDIVMGSISTKRFKFKRFKDQRISLSLCITM